MAVIPNSCRECNQHDCVNHQFEWFMKNNPNINNANSVSPACPLLKEVSQAPTTKNDLGVDCISRADAIRVASGYCHPSNVAKELAKLPLVTPQEPRKGHWILDETDNSITCDKCGCLIWANDISNGEAYFCPNCGCKMVEPQESEDT